MKNFCLLVLVVLLAACEVPTSKSNLGGASLTIGLSDNSSRSILPSQDMNVAGYTINGTNLGDGSTFSRSAPSTATQVTVNALMVGNWNIVVSALNSGGVTIGSGSTTTALLANQVNTVTITVSPLSGNGTLSMNFNWPATVTNPSISAKLVPIAPTTGSTITLSTLISGQTATSVVNSLPSGYYTLTVVLMQNSVSIAGSADIVRIVAGQTTQGSYGFSAGNLDGVLLLKLIPNMRTALVPQLFLPGSPSLIEGGSPLAFSASLLAQPQGQLGPLSVDYSWYLNGVFQTKITPAIGVAASFPFAGSNLNPGVYRMDLTAVATDGSSGSVGLEFEKAFGAQWAKTGTSGTANFVDVASDGNGNVYAVGQFSGSVNFGSGTVASGGGTTTPVIVKYSESGALLGVVAVGAPGGGLLSGVAIGPSGEVVVAGTLGLGTSSFGNGVSVVSQASSANPVVALFSPALLAQWAKTSTAGTNAYFNDVAVISTGEVIAAGSVSGGSTAGVTFGGTITIPSEMNKDMPIAVKFSSAGAPVWGRSVVSASGSTHRYVKIVADAAGNTYLLGTSMSGPVTFATGITIPTTAIVTSYVAKLNSSGTYLWAAGATNGAGAVWGQNDVAVDSVGNVYTAGSVSFYSGATSATIQWGNGVNLSVMATGPSLSSPVLVKYGSSGQALWAVTNTTQNSVSGSYSSVAVYDNGDPVVGGTFSGTTPWNLGNGVTAQGPFTGPNPVLVKYTSTGTPRWAQIPVSGNAGMVISKVNVENTSHLYVAGSFGSLGTLGLLGPAPVSVSGVAGGPFLAKF